MKGTVTTTQEVSRIAAEAYADRRTVVKLLRGEYVRPMVAARIRAALVKLARQRREETS